MEDVDLGFRLHPSGAEFRYSRECWAIESAHAGRGLRLRDAGAAGADRAGAGHFDEQVVEQLRPRHPQDQVRHNIGIRLELPNRSFDAVILTSRLRGLGSASARTCWPRPSGSGREPWSPSTPRRFRADAIPAAVRHPSRAADGLPGYSIHSYETSDTGDHFA